jgi:hypothetical protein
VAFLDEDELQPGGGGPRRTGAERQRQLLLRRVIALAVGVLLIILLLLAVRGCLNAREERGFENYVSDLDTIVAQSNQLSADFFNRLQSPEQNADSLELEAQISSDRGTAESLLQRVEGLDTPDELAEAQIDLERAFELRRDGLAGIAEDIPTALGDEGRQDALERIAQDMRGFLASDVLYARAQAEIVSVLEDQGIAVPEALVDVVPFLQPPEDQWLDTLQLSAILSAYATNTGAADGLRGLGLISTTINKTPLTVGVDNSVSLGDGPPTLKIEVENQGDQEENDVAVQYSLSGGLTTIEGEGQIPSIDSGGTDEAVLELPEAPEPEVSLTLEVEVFAVPGESSTDNNAATYTVTFN